MAFAFGVNRSCHCHWWTVKSIIGCSRLPITCSRLFLFYNYNNSFIHSFYSVYRRYVQARHVWWVNFTLSTARNAWMRWNVVTTWPHCVKTCAVLRHSQNWSLTAARTSNCCYSGTTSRTNSAISPPTTGTAHLPTPLPRLNVKWWNGTAFHTKSNSQLSK